MSVTLYEPALEALLDSQEGPVGQFIEAIAVRVTQQAQANVRDYFHSAPTLTVDQDVDMEMQGSTAVVGIRDGGSKSRRIARAQADGTFPWLTRALDAGRT